MELVILFIIGALLIFGPRKGGRMLARRSPEGEGGPSKFAMIVGAAFLLWMLMAFGMGALWKAAFGVSSF